MHPERIYHLFETGIRSRQEDYIWPIPGKAGVNDKVFVVCDGEGSFQNGDIPSKLICQFMAASVVRYNEQRMNAELIDRFLNEARDELIGYARENKLDTDLSTTFSMLILYDQRALISWCGNSPVYHVRGGEILFHTNEFTPVTELPRDIEAERGIKADHSTIHATTRWIDDVQDGDYFMLGTKGISENITDDEIKLLVTQNEQENNDLADRVKQLIFEKKPDNYSMYWIRVRAGIVHKSIPKGNTATRIPSVPRMPGIEQIQRLQTGGNRTPLLILAGTILALFIMVLFFRKSGVSDSVVKNNDTNIQRLPDLGNEALPSAIVMAPQKTATIAVDSVKSKRVNLPIAPQADPLLEDQPEESPAPVEKTPDDLKVPAQLLLKYSTDESCILSIKNLDQDEVIHWDLAQNDAGTIYLKPGKYSILATSTRDSSKSKTYYFDVKYGYANTREDLHIKF